jgi:hypothetical protein
MSEQTTQATCFHCDRKFMASRSAVSFWPDHLWIGAVQSLVRCECGKWASVGWAHDLPKEWQEDVPRKDWLQYCLPRMIWGCHHYGIPADLLPEFSRIPGFRTSYNPVPGQLHRFDVRTPQKRSFWKTLLMR